MKIHLIFSPTTFQLNHGDMGKGFAPPLGILYLAAYLRKYSPFPHDIIITDGLLEGFDNTLDIICKVKADIIGISSVTPNIVGAYRLINMIKGKMAESKVILGGPHPTAMPEEAFKYSQPDAVVIGEGEETFMKLVHYYGNGRYLIDDMKKIDGVCVKDENEVVITKPRKFISDLDSIPFPARDLVDMKRYSGYPISRGKLSTIFLGSRGCPFCCTFCSNNVWKTSSPIFRLRSPKNIADELQELKKQGFDEFFDQSDEFNANIKHSKEVLREIISRGLKIKLQCQLRAKPVDDELVKLMRDAGFWYIHLGIESGNRETLEGIKKRVSLEDVEKCCAILQKYGIKIWGLFMFFNIWEKDGRLCYEDYDMSLNTLNYAKNLYKKKLVNFFGGSITTPVPGSPLWDIALRHNLIKEECYDNYDLWFYKRDLRLVSRLPEVSETDIFKLHQMTYKFTIRTLMRERMIKFSNVGFALIRTGYFLKKGILLWIRRLGTRFSNDKQSSLC